MATMDLNLARTFAEVADARSFTAAAKRLGVPTSSVSRAITRLETELRTKLFERTTRRTSLTAAGRVYHEHVCAAIDALNAGELRVSELLGQPRGEVRLTFPVNLDGGFLARQLRDFSVAHPQVQLFTLPSNQWVDLEAERVDLALRVMQRSATSPLLLRPLGDFHAHLVASPEYVKQFGAPRRPKELASHACINMMPGRMTLRLIGKRGVEEVRVGGAIASNDMQFVRQLAEQGAGIGPMIFPPGERPTLPRGLVRVLPDWVVEGPTLYLASMSKKSQPLRVRLLRDWLLRAYGQNS